MCVCVCVCVCVGYCPYLCDPSKYKIFHSTAIYLHFLYVIVAQMKATKLQGNVGKFTRIVFLKSNHYLEYDQVTSNDSEVRPNMHSKI